MSDFASLLSQLDKSAKQAPPGNKNRNQREERDSRKRPRKSDIGHSNNTQQSDTRKRSKITSCSKPHDASQLTINLGFVCIGAQKAGTSWLHEMLRQIPGLGLPEQKEVHFWDWHRKKGLAWYSTQFPRSPTTPLVYGEITPCYMTLSESDIAEIHALFPKLRIVFIARDLVQRAWSALTMELRNNVQGMQAGQFHNNTNTTDLDSVTQNRMEKEADPDRQTDEYFMNRLEHSTHTQRSDYAAGLRRWLQYFDAEQILIVNYDEISKDPKGLMEKVLTHIGVTSELELPMSELQKRFNVATKPRPIRPSLRKKMEAYLQPRAKEFNGLLKESGYEWTLEEYE